MIPYELSAPPYCFQASDPFGTINSYEFSVFPYEMLSRVVSQRYRRQRRTTKS